MNDAPPADDTEPQTLGAYLKAKRNAAGLSQQQLAGRLGITQQSVQQWEADGSVPSPRTLHFLTQQLPGVEAAELLALIPGSR